MELDYKAIGKRLKMARTAADLKQEKLAEIVAISPTHLSNIENGSARVSLQTLVHLANALSVSIDALLCDNIQAATPVFHQEISALLADCSHYELRIITCTLTALKESLRQDEKSSDR